MSHHSWQSRESVGVQTDAVPTAVDEVVALAAAPYAATASLVAVTEYVTPALVETFSAPSPVTEDVAPAPAVTYAAPAPMIEYVAPATPETVNACVAPAPVIEYIEPTPAVFYPSFYPSFSQPNEAVTCLVNPQIFITADEASQVQVVVQENPEFPVVESIQEQSAVTDLVDPQISITAVQASQVVGSFPLSEDFAAPKYNQVDQEQIVATVQPQVIVQEIPQLLVAEWIQEQNVETIEVIPQEQTEVQIGDIPVPQEQIIAEVTTMKTSTSSSSTWTSSDRRLDEFTNMLDSCSYDGSD